MRESILPYTKGFFVRWLYTGPVNVLFKFSRVQLETVVICTTRNVARQLRCWVGLNCWHLTFAEETSCVCFWRRLAYVSSLTCQATVRHKYLENCCVGQLVSLKKRSRCADLFFAVKVSLFSNVDISQACRQRLLWLEKLSGAFICSCTKF